MEKKVNIFFLFGILIALFQTNMASASELASISASETTIHKGDTIEFNTYIQNADTTYCDYTLHILCDGVDQIVYVLNTPQDSKQFLYPPYGQNYSTITARIDRVGKNNYYEGNLNNLAQNSVLTDNSAATLPDSNSQIRDALDNVPGVAELAFVFLVFSVIGGGTFYYSGRNKK